ncbi:helical backbone metal receptor [Nonomuraea roseoviolacea]|uniref:ABC-type Fe3+-hydroxamate transport system substrate-binding protein n=1 Tax=Nonomuraea roseoviolacea subsp. carminata TaxID=160689 RepID=A0ABT1JXH7_9ACTN|nr:helical backbone metal receptor [Nonomuraea roseoviolacea]MCP2345469.1 ABC-type Fe3+-hydroxamate transport system substrate-binding protein [Nonomuraea roseoviolacea subsp. carminata]
MTEAGVRDDTGAAVRVPESVTRIVSLVPSLTESVAATVPGALVGATDWCSHPAGLDVTRVRGTKNPDLDVIRSLRPDVVLANAEENREPDLAALRAAGLAVWVTRIETLDQAFASLERMFTEACRAEPPAWLDEAREVWRKPEEGPRRTAVVPIWRRPWMVVGRDTFTGDVLRRLGVDNLYAGHAERYPKVPLAELTARAPDLVVLPDEPYAFHAGDGPECFPGLRCALVSGRDLTWYGPSLVTARARLARALAG